jgi:succinyl-diaminopimelate desuccinylase
MTDAMTIVGRVMDYVTRERLAEAVCGLVDTPSPTGAEAPAAAWIAAHLAGAGLDARVQPLDERQANAVAVLPGRGDGPSTLLYAPLDTFTAGDAALDVPWAAAEPRPDLLPRASIHGDLVQGLGAGNPKGHAACVLVAIAALANAGVEPRGDVVAGFGAGGMPSFTVDGAGTPGRHNTGHGAGAGFLLERGYTTDYAVIAKPGWAVSHEEVGLVWLDVLVPGIHTYVGSRHRLPYRNAVALAGAVAGHLEPRLVVRSSPAPTKIGWRPCSATRRRHRTRAVLRHAAVAGRHRQRCALREARVGVDELVRRHLHGPLSRPATEDHFA